MPVRVALTGYLRDLHVLEPLSATWTELSGPTSGTPPSERHAMSMAGVGDAVFVFGGYGDRGPLGDMFVFDPANLTWTELRTFARGHLPSRRGHAATAAHAGQLFLFGGERGNSMPPFPRNNTSSDSAPLSLRNTHTHSSPLSLLPSFSLSHPIMTPPSLIRVEAVPRLGVLAHIET